LGNGSNLVWEPYFSLFSRTLAGTGKCEVGMTSIVKSGSEPMCQWYWPLYAGLQPQWHELPVLLPVLKGYFGSRRDGC
jgi:hypothetical protein